MLPDNADESKNGLIDKTKNLQGMQDEAADVLRWHLDWDVDQRESATNPATTGVTDERPVNSKRYHAADLINHIKGNGGTFTGSKEDLAKAVWPVKTPSGRTILQ